MTLASATTMTSAQISIKIHGVKVTQGQQGAIRKLMLKLQSIGLVEKEGKGWRLADEMDTALPMAALDLGLLGKTDEVKAKHQRDRDGFEAKQNSDRRREKSNDTCSECEERPETRMAHH
jgi:hypothetical protein